METPTIEMSIQGCGGWQYDGQPEMTSCWIDDRKVSTGVYLPAWVLLRGCGCSWAIFNQYHTIYDIYIDISTLRSVAPLLFSRFGVWKTAPSVHIFVTSWCRKLVCSAAMMPGSNCRRCSGFMWLSLGFYRFCVLGALKGRLWNQSNEDHFRLGDPKNYISGYIFKLTCFKKSEVR
jgi:hypothetical protein